MSETRKDFEERRWIYFEKNPTFEEWCEDVFFYPTSREDTRLYRR